MASRVVYDVGFDNSVQRCRVVHGRWQLYNANVPGKTAAALPSVSNLAPIVRSDNTARKARVNVQIRHINALQVV